MSERYDAINTADVWQENRDKIFLNRFAADIAKLADAGVPDEIIIKVCCNYDYVKAWASCPKWLWPVDKLPKGYKWSDGERHHIRAGKHSDARTIILLPIEDDLYVRDTFLGRNKKYRIRDFRRYAAKDIAIEFSLLQDDYLSGLILELYKKMGLPIGYIPKFLKNMKRNFLEQNHEV